MITMNNEKFESDEFAMQIIAKGAFIDSGTGDGHSYVVETTAIRLNHIALNAWILSQTSNSRDCYETREEWERCKAESDKEHEAVRVQIIGDLGLDPNKGSICITQAHAEMFAVIYIWKVK